MHADFHGRSVGGVRRTAVAQGRAAAAAVARGAEHARREKPRDAAAGRRRRLRGRVAQLLRNIDARGREVAVRQRRQRGLRRRRGRRVGDVHLLLLLVRVRESLRLEPAHGLLD